MTAPMNGGKTMEAISEFRNEYFFLSNFYPVSIFYNGLYFNSTEAAFQAMKCPSRMKEFQTLNPSEAKKLGRHVAMRIDWEEVKEQVMYDICSVKFTQNPLLAQKLLDTSDAELIEGNTWGDKTWGVCNGEGKNLLGKILMRIRSELQVARSE